MIQLKRYNQIQRNKLRKQNSNIILLLFFVLPLLLFNSCVNKTKILDYEEWKEVNIFHDTMMVPFGPSLQIPCDNNQLNIIYIENIVLSLFSTAIDIQSYLQKHADYNIIEYKRNNHNIVMGKNRMGNLVEFFQIVYQKEHLGFPLPNHTPCVLIETRCAMNESYLMDRILKSYRPG